MIGKRWLQLFSVFFIAFTLAACGNNGESKDSRTGALTGNQPRRGGTLLVGLDNNPKDFDPMVASDTASLAVVPNIVEGLVKIDTNYEIKPWLAEKFDVSADGLTYTFSLRDGVKFHDGTNMDAESVRFSIQRIRDNIRSPGNTDSQDIADINVVNRTTISITLKEPNSPFLSKMTGRLGGVVSPTAIKSMGDEAFNQHPVGTGPFKFSEYKSDTYVKVTRFESYWRMGLDGKPQPYLDAVQWLVMPNADTRLLALQNGSVQIVNSIRDQDAVLVRKDPNLVYAQQAGTGVFGFMLTIDTSDKPGHEKGPLETKELRQALQFAIDRDEIVKTVFDGNREMANGPIPPTVAWAVDPSYKPYAYNPAMAKEMLAKGGKPTGFSFTATASDTPTNRLLLELVKAQLIKVGIDMKAEIVAPDVLQRKWRMRESDASLLSFSGGSPDPDNPVSALFLPKGAFNAFPYDNPQVTELILKARRTSNVDERAKLYKQMVPLIMTDSPFVMLTYSVDRFTGSKKVGNWYTGYKATSGFAEYFLND